MSAGLVHEGMQAELFELLLRLGDDRLVLGHRLSQWCGHAHDLEDDIALANIALDCIGQAEMCLREAGRIEQKGRDENKLAFFREAIAYRNCLLVELPRGDFGFTIVRQLMYDVFSVNFLKSLTTSSEPLIAGLAEKFLKEARYHLRYSSGWFVRLADGTEESHERIQGHLDSLWAYSGELFEADEVTTILQEKGVLPAGSLDQSGWCEEITKISELGKLKIPEASVMQTGGRSGRHTEHLGHLLSEMQILPRSYPDAVW